MSDASPGTQSPDSAAAGRWFGVRVVYQTGGFWWTTWAVMKNCFFLVVTLGFSMVAYDPKRFCDVIIFRRDTGRPVRRYDYSSPEEAWDHVESLGTRLGEMQVFDFCRDLGIGMHEVVGGGQEQPARPDGAVAERLEVRAADRYRNEFS